MHVRTVEVDIITSVVLQLSAYKLRKEFVRITIIIYKIA